MITLQEALDIYRPSIVADFTATVRRAYKRHADQHGIPTLGDKEFRRNNFNRGTVALCCYVADPVTHERRDGAGKMSDIYLIDDQKLDERADKYAGATTDKWQAKIQTKLTELDEYSVENMKGGNLVITGRRNGHNVTLLQQTILKVSSRGTLFNQFPARLYVDGKFTPEKKFADATA